MEQGASQTVSLKLRLRNFQSAFSSSSTQRNTFQEKDTEITVLYSNAVQSDIPVCKQHLTGTSYLHLHHAYPEEVKKKIFPKYYYIYVTGTASNPVAGIIISYKRQQKQHDTIHNN